MFFDRFSGFKGILDFAVFSKNSWLATDSAQNVVLDTIHVKCLYFTFVTCYLSNRYSMSSIARDSRMLLETGSFSLLVVSSRGLFLVSTTFAF